MNNFLNIRRWKHIYEQIPDCYACFDIVHTIKCANLFIFNFSLFENAAIIKLFSPENQGA
jgi:hypothetical protein